MRLKNKFGVLLFLLMALAVNGIAATNVRIVGQAIEYAGDSLQFLTYSDYLTLAEEPLATIKVAADGKFEANFNVKETQMVFLHLGVYKMYLYAQPNGYYDVVLPAKRAKTQAEILNPYFEEVEEMLGIRNYKDSDLNFLIHAFDNSFEPYLNTFALNIYAKRKPEELTVALNSMETSFPDRHDAFFIAYYRYKTGLLRHWAYQFKAKAISVDYFKSEPVLYHNPAFMELFSVVYDKYFMYFGRSPKGEAIYSAINTDRSLYKLKEVLNQDSVFTNNQLKELVIVKCLYDEFYQSSFSRSAILTILDSVATTSPYIENKHIAQRMKRKITRLMVGFEPPAFALADTSGQLFTSQSWKGKPVYLSFCTSASYSSLKDFKMLDNLKSRFGDKIEIVTILADNTEAMRTFVKQNNYKWTFLSFANKPDVLKEYDIRAFPTYFLLSPEGKLRRSPAKAPSEGIEIDFLDLEKERIRKEGNEQP